MKRLKTRAAALLTALCLLTAPGLPCVQAEPAEIVIATIQDLETFAKNASLDVWSQGRTVRLTKDLDLTGRKFTPIPTFGGTFLGDGHKITGLRVTAAGSNMGLFRYLQKGAVVQDLHVSGTVRPEGSAVNVGGVVGNNAGAVRNCSFSGAVEGTGAVGGIAGLNQESGEIAGTETAGTISGEDCTGGTAGRNLGTLLQCENRASVNTSNPDEDAEPVTLQEPESAAAAETEAAGILDGHSDTGGIAGRSSGVIQSCINRGTVGYPHVGYNAGGIVGRQNGYLSGCINEGTVYGRKDVGGIAGQAEPDVALTPDAGTLERLRRELDSLEALLDQTVSHAEGQGDRLSERLDAMSGDAGTAKDHAQTLLNQVQEFADGNLSVLNTLSADVTNALDGLTPALDALAGASDGLGDLTDRLETALDSLAEAVDGGQDIASDAGSAVEILRRAGDLLEEGAAAFRRAARSLQNAVIVRDPSAMDAALTDLGNALETLGSGADQAGLAMERLRAALGSLRESLRPGGGGLEAALAALEQARTAFSDMASGLKQAGAGLRQTAGALRRVNGNLDVDWNQARQALTQAVEGLDGLQSAAGRLNSALRDVQEAMDGLRTLAGDLGGAMGELADAAGLGRPVGEHLQTAFQILRDQIADLTEDGPRELIPLGDAAREASDGLFGALSGFSDGLDHLRTEIGETGDTLAEDLRAVNRQFNAVFTVLMDAIEDVRNGENDSQILEDTSDEDIAATRLGKITGCTNTGSIDGDRNVGGIAGSMSIEVDVDPEGDLSLSLGGTYETKAVLESSVNKGPVTVKKDCAGGLAGRMDLGTVIGCENYGPIASTGGGCTGGIAGLTAGVVRESYAKCTLSAGRAVGGIAGQAGADGLGQSLRESGSLRDCCAIATILEGTECVGAIAGSAEMESVRNCVFVDVGAAGIDGVSYAGSAEPIGYEELRQRPGIPTAFLSFNLTLTADGETVREIPFAYGQDLSRLELPEPPEKEGFYGTWPDFDPSGTGSDVTLEAVYHPWVTLVASAETEGVQALALAEGQFTDSVRLEVRESTLSQAGTGGDVWEVTLTGADVTETPLRLLNRSGGRASVWQYEDGRWNAVKSHANGSYVCFSMEGNSGIFCVHASENGAAYLLAAGAAAVLAALLFLAKRAGKRRKTTR